jgi:hypothetical protein
MDYKRLTIKGRKLVANFRLYTFFWQENKSYLDIIDARKNDFSKLPKRRREQVNPKNFIHMQHYHMHDGSFGVILNTLQLISNSTFVLTKQEFLHILLRSFTFSLGG